MNNITRTVEPHAAKDPAAIGRRDFLRGAGLLAAGGLAGGLNAGCDREPQQSTGGAAGGASALAAATPAEQALIAAAQREGKLMLYSGSEESIVANLAKAFREAYGVTVEYQRLSSNEIATRYTAEAQAGRTIADVVLTGDRELFQIFGDKGWLATLDPAVIHDLNAWPADFKDQRSAIVSVVPYTIGINTDKVLEAPKDWQYLISPEAKSGIVTVDAKRVNLVAIAAWDLMLKLYGDEFLRAVGRQQMKLVDSGPSAVQQLASGAAKAYFPCSRTNAESMIAQGAPVKAILPENLPYTGVMSEVAVSAGATHPNAALLYLSFLLKEQGQKILNVVGSSPANIPGTPPLPAGFVKPDFISAAANKAKIIELLGM